MINKATLWAVKANAEIVFTGSYDHCEAYWKNNMLAWDLGLVRGTRSMFEISKLEYIDERNERFFFGRPFADASQNAIA